LLLLFIRRSISHSQAWRSSAKPGASSVIDRTPKTVNSVVDGEVGCFLNAVQQQLKIDRPLGASHVATVDDRSRQRPVTVVKLCIAESGQSAPCKTERPAKFNTPSHWQPMKSPQAGRAVLTPSNTSS